MQSDHRKPITILFFKASALVGCSLLLLALLATPDSVLATSCAASQSLSATSLINSELSTWTISVTLSADTSTFTIEYRIPEGARLQKGTTEVIWSGDTPCCYEKTIAPGTFGGGAVYLDFTQGPKNLTTGSTIILTIERIKNPNQGLPTISGINFYSSGPNEPAVGSCFLGAITASSPSLTPTNTPILPTSTPVLPTDTPLPTSPLPTLETAVAPTVADTPVALEPTLAVEPPESSTREENGSQSQRSSFTQPAPLGGAPTTQTPSRRLEPERKEGQILPTATPLIDSSLLEKLKQQSKEEVVGLDDRSKKVLAVFLGEATGLFLLMFILILKGFVF